MPEQAQELSLVVGGRTFAPVDFETGVTARRDDWVQAQLAEAGLHRLLSALATDAAAAEALLRQAVAAGRKQVLLAGLLDEIDVTGQPIKWTPERAMALAEVFAETTVRAERQALDAAFVVVLVRFFQAALGLSAGSPISSTPSADASARRSPPEPPVSAPSAERALASGSSPSPATSRRPRRRRPRPTPSAPGAD